MDDERRKNMRPSPDRNVGMLDDISEYFGPLAQPASTATAATRTQPRNSAVRNAFIP
jgi:hypothetical protein